MAHIHAYDHESRDTHGQTPGACGAAESGGRESVPVEKKDGSEVYAGTEVSDLRALFNRLWVNGELRQEARVSEVTIGAAELIDLISPVMTLHRGDVIASGAPQDVGPTTPGGSGGGIRTVPKVF